ncbi:hypothetical protein [Thermomonospora umbrina]|uniref:Uncharacterized protein n=1 Tax=Thermomonospora umbrina TaxID=111806 RepID=A0A3D9SXG7_9ACTN|nr:hypothetical protein [Thermomonospora umbrina]REE98743.1 hypothetical protein DFJ69_4238 [Thermomonospora umbrina]
MDLNGIREVRAWIAEVGPFDLRTFMLSNVSIAEAGAVAMLVLPRFIEYRGCVLLDFTFDEAGVDLWLERLQGERKAVEAMVNHVHLWDFFAPRAEAENEVLKDLGRRMVASWEAMALLQFPQKSFTVKFDDGSNDYGPTLAISTA